MATPIIDTIINVSKLEGNQQEPTIAINQANPLQLFVASNNGGDNLFTSYSDDGGMTWTQSYKFDGEPPSDMFPIACCDPTARSDSIGNLFLSYISTEPNPDPELETHQHAVLVKSTDFGKTFSLVDSMPNPLDNPPHDLDQPHIATGDILNTNEHLIYMCWEDGGTEKGEDKITPKLTTNRNPGIYVAGAKYIGNSTPDNLIMVNGDLNPNYPSSNGEAPGSTLGNFGDISIGPNGKVMVVYQTPVNVENVPNDIVINTFDGSDPSSTVFWSDPIVAATTNVWAFYSIPAQPNRMIDAEAKLDWDKTGGKYNGRVYLVYTDASSPNPAIGANNMNIMLKYSDNDGATWSQAIQINDTSVNSRFFPRVKVDQSTGTVGVSWYDCRNSANNDTWQPFCAFSNQGGIAGSWTTPNIQITNYLINSTEAVTGDPNEAGDYADCAFFHNVFYPVWADNVVPGNPDPPTLDIATVKISLAQQAKLTDLGANFRFTLNSLSNTTSNLIVNFYGDSGTINDIENPDMFFSPNNPTEVIGPNGNMTTIGNLFDSVPGAQFYNLSYVGTGLFTVPSDTNYVYLDFNNNGVLDVNNKENLGIRFADLNKSQNTLIISGLMNTLTQFNTLLLTNGTDTVQTITFKYFLNNVDVTNEITGLNVVSVSLQPHHVYMYQLAQGEYDTIQIDPPGVTVVGVFLSATPFNPGPVPCFFGDTLIKTPKGDIPVMNLRKGDIVYNCLGDERKIEFVACRHIFSSENSKKVNPYLIKKGSLTKYFRYFKYKGEKPSQDTYISGDHQIRFNQEGIRAAAINKRLKINEVNQVANQYPITYYTVCLEDCKHGHKCKCNTIIANNMPIESTPLQNKTIQKDFTKF